MKKIALLTALILTNNAFAGWTVLNEDNKAIYYWDKTSIDKDRQPFSKGIVFWARILLKTPQYVGNTKNSPKFDELLYLYNVECYSKAMKTDEMIFKYKGKKLWQKTQDGFAFSNYGYSPPNSNEEKFILMVCSERDRQNAALLEELHSPPKKPDTRMEDLIKMLDGKKE